MACLQCGTAAQDLISVLGPECSGFGSWTNYRETIFCLHGVRTKRVYKKGVEDLI